MRHRRTTGLAVMLVMLAAIAPEAWTMPIWVLVGGMTDRLDAPLSYTGLTPENPSTSWPVTGVPAPDGAWWGDDPTGSGGKTTAAFSLAAGADEEVPTPFCADGSFVDLTTGDCMKARRFGGTADEEYRAASTATAQIGSGDFSICLLFEHSKAGGTNDRLAVTRDLSATNEGYDVYYNRASSLIRAYIHDGSSGITVNGPVTKANDGAWYLGCLLVDFDGNSQICDVTGCGPPGATPHASAINNVEVLTINGYPDTTATYSSTIAFIPWWNSLLTSGQVVTLAEHFMGILDNRGAPVSCTTTGPVGHWVDGKLEVFGDDWCVIGSELPPGVTGAGTPHAGLHSVASYTNSAVYSRVISSQTAVGTPVETNTSVDLFRDGRTTVRVCDDDGAAVEGESTGVINISALNTGSKVQVCVYAKDSTGTVLDLQVDESGVCGGSTINFAAKTITTSWAQYEWTHTVADGTCTGAAYKISPTDWATVASQTCAEWVVRVYLNQDFCPPIYCETAAAAVTCGKTALIYDVSGTSIVDGSGDLKSKVSILANWAPAYNNTNNSPYLLDLSDNSTSDRALLQWGATEVLQYYTISGGAGGATLITSGVRTITPGTAKALRLDVDYDADAYGLWADGASLGTASDAKTSPTGITDLDIGSAYNESGQSDGWISDVEVRK